MNRNLLLVAAFSAAAAIAVGSASCGSNPDNGDSGVDGNGLDVQNNPDGCTNVNGCSNDGGTCSTLGKSCSGNGDCCSGNCAGGSCQLAPCTKDNGACT